MNRDLSKPNPSCNTCNGLGQPHFFPEQPGNLPCPVCWNYSIQNEKIMPSRYEMAEMVIGLYSALAQRNDCPGCGGRGIQYVEVDGEAEAEPCDCHTDAWQVLNDCEKSFKAVVDEYLWLCGIDEEEILAEWQSVEVGLLERLKEKMKNV